MGISGQKAKRIKEIVIVRIDIDECVDNKAFFYIALKLASYDLILELL